MSIIQAAGAGEAPTDFYSFEISNSLRFNDDDSSFLSRTPSSASNRRTFTFSCWVKRANIPSGESYLFSTGTDGNNFFGLEFIGGEIVLQNYNSGTQVIARTGTALFRDTAAWYNIVLAVDTTESTQEDRLKLYVNGTQVTSFDGSDSDLSLNYDTQVNNTNQHTIGCRELGSQDAFHDGYMAEINFIDGSALTPASFGETKENIWIAKDTSGLTFGTNGFRLQFKNSSVGSASSSTVGADTSGRDNHFTSTNIATTDNMPDSPNINFAVMNSLDLVSTGATLSDGNLTWSIGGADGAGRSNFVMTSGKWYVEAGVGGAVSDYIGVISGQANITGVNGTQTVLYAGDGTKRVNGSSSSYGASFASTDIIGIALDLDSGTQTVEFFKNNASQGSINLTDVGSEGYAIGCGSGSGNRSTSFNFGQDSTGISSAATDENGFGTFEFAPPSGYLALCTANFPDPAIDPASNENPTDYFNTVLYTGNGSTQSITGVNFSPNWTWIKNRSANDSHVLTDSVRGVTKEIQSNASTEETTNADGLTAFGADGFSLGDDVAYNTSSENYVSWNWKAGTSQSFSGESGTLDSTVSSSSESGFSIVKYTGGSDERIKHGLGAIPEWILVKRTTADACNWAVYHADMALNNFMELNSSGDEQLGSNPRFLSSTYSTSIPTSTYFFVRNFSGSTTNNTGDEYIAYCFAPKDGFSKFGFYEGNNSTDNAFVFTGFRPAFLMIKNVDATANWGMWDVKRDTFNLAFNILRADTNDIEGTAQPNNDIDILSNGFKVRGNTGVSGDAVTYIYMAFAEQPLKYSNAR